mgnify:CR=1 FL=1
MIDYHAEDRVCAEFQSLQQRGGYSKHLRQWKVQKVGFEVSIASTARGVFQVESAKKNGLNMSCFNRFNSAGGIPRYLACLQQFYQSGGFNRFNSAGGIPRPSWRSRPPNPPRVSIASTARGVFQARRRCGGSGHPPPVSIASTARGVFQAGRTFEAC